jgi:hypothetical protein
MRTAFTEFLGSRRATEGKEDSQEEEEEVTVRRKLHNIRIASEVRCARSTDRWQLSPTEYPRNKQ